MTVSKSNPRHVIRLSRKAAERRRIAALQAACGLANAAGTDWKAAP